MKRKKVLFLITKSNWGGAQRYVFDLATNLPKDKFEVAVALGGNGPLIEKLEKENIRVIQIKGLQRDISFLKELKAFRNIYKIIKEENPDVLHVNSSKAGGIGAFMGRISAVSKIIYTSHGWAFNEDRDFLFKLMAGYFHWLTILLSHTTITVSDALQKQMGWPFVKNKMKTVHNGRAISDMLERESARQTIITQTQELNEYKDDFWSVTVAELHPVKQHDVTITAIKGVVAKHPNVRHVIIGDGQERENLERMVKENGLANNIFFAGTIDEASKYLKAFDLFVLSSRSEALAYVIIEACSAGLPIIASRVGGIPEIITNNEEGVLIPSGDTAVLANAYASLYENPELRKGYAKKASDRAIYFTIEKMVEETEKLYN